MPGVTVPKRFQIVRQLGEGGMGVVYEAFDTERNACVALKTARATAPETLERFKHEFRAMQDLHHPNLVSLGELVSEGGQWFFTMELLDGVDFLEHVRGTIAATAATAIGPSQSSPTASVMPGSAKAPSLRPAADPAEPAFDEKRLRNDLRQLASALAALHDAGIVHRDLKPSNVRVTSEGRLVLLDFGLVSDTSDGGGHALSGTNVVGTPQYMAPEQAVGRNAGPEADLYSLGVMLHEALTGRVPIDGNSLEVLLRKQRETPASPSTLVKGVPLDLDALCVALLRFEPAARPTAHQILAALGAGVPIGAVAKSQTQNVPFVGRDEELKAIGDAFAGGRARAVAMLVTGASGLGKSCLVRRFIETAAREHRDLVVLAGRCYEREDVPYKAFDGVVDSLVRFLRKLPDNEAGAYLPVRPAPLAKVFPTLRGVRAIAESLSRTQAPTPVDPLELRARAFAGLREMLLRLTDKRSLLLVIDDIQWTDADSLALLADILRPPDAPRLLLLATVRTSATSANENGERVRAALEPIGVDVRTLELPRLSSEEAHSLASMLLARVAPDSRLGAEAIVREGEGHPFFIDALVRHAMLAEDADLGSLRLEDALWSRVEGLDATAREIVELLSVAGAPITHDVLDGAMETKTSSHASSIAFLRVAHLIGISGARGTDTVEPYHDRVRAAVLAHLDEDTKRRCHRRLAIAHESTGGTDLEALSVHWHGAGDDARAATYAARAGDRSADALAFDHAAALYETALALGEDQPGRAALKEKLGVAYANAGRAARAATAYRSAARDVDPTRALDLNRRAADQLLRAGHFEEGLATAAEVLRSIGLSLPRSPLAALWMLLVWQLYLRVRGLRFRARDESQVAPQALARIDMLWTVSFGLALADNIMAAAFGARHVAMALGVGERKRIGRALALEAGFVASVGNIARAERFLALAMSLAEETGDRHLLGFTTATHGFIRQLEGRFVDALPLYERALQILAECPGAAYELDSAQVLGVQCLGHAGRFREIARRVPRYLRDAIDRGDVYAAVNLDIGVSSSRWLAEDDPVGARQAAAAAMAQWPKNAFHVEHWYELDALTRIELYEGNVEAAHAGLLGRWAAMERSLLLRVAVVAAFSLYLRAITGVWLAAARPADAATLLRGARRDAKRMARKAGACGNGFSRLVLAAIATHERRTTDATATLREAITHLEASGLRVYAAAAERRLAALIGGEEGAARVATVDAWMKSEGVKDPARMCFAFLPVRDRD